MTGTAPWLDDFDAAVQQASADGKFLLVDLTADW